MSRAFAGRCRRYGAIRNSDERARYSVPSRSITQPVMTLSFFLAARNISESCGQKEIYVSFAEYSLFYRALLQEIERDDSLLEREKRAERGLLGEISLFVAASLVFFFLSLSFSFLLFLSLSFFFFLFPFLSL